MSLHKFVYPPLALCGLALLFAFPLSKQVGGWIEAIQAAGEFPNGAPLRTTYTGIGLIDHQIMFLVAFFMPFADGSNPDSRIFAIYFMIAGLMPNLPLWQVEELRGGPARGIRYTALWNMVMQVMGVCCVAPIFFFIHSDHASSGFDPADVAIPHAEAAAILPATIISYIIPSILMFLPAPLISPLTRQLVIAIWQIFPLVFFGVYQLLLRVLPHRKKGAEHNQLKALYTTIIGVAFLANAYVLQYILLSPQPWERFKGVFVPNLRPADLRETAFLYIQADFLVAGIASLVWTVYQVWGFVRVRGGAAFVTGVVAATVLLGPGVVMTGLFRWREGKLRERKTGGKKKA